MNCIYCEGIHTCVTTNIFGIFYCTLCGGYFFDLNYQENQKKSRKSKKIKKKEVNNK